MRAEIAIRQPVHKTVSKRIQSLGCARLHNACLHSGVNAATLIMVGPVKVEFEGVAKSTWNL
jgi:hypothetical protein